MFVNRKIKKQLNKIIASLILVTMLNQIAAPTVAFALTSGPTSPEATSFEPIDTTDMVNPLTGDFTYNLPLLEVPGPEGGYPISLSYHAGIQPNEDASWVGLGWTLNPGAITRSVNGFPDDWGGVKTSRRDYWAGGAQTTYNVGVSVGLPGPVGNVSFGLAFSQDTYKGFGAGMNLGIGIGLSGSGLGMNASVGILPFGGAYAGAGIDIGGKGNPANMGVGITTNFESVAVNGNAGAGPILGTSMSSEVGSSSFSVGGISGSTSNGKAGNISTSSSGFSFGIPILPGLNASLGYSKIRYWSDETTNTETRGSLTIKLIGVSDVLAHDNYSLLAPDRDMVRSPDPRKVQGGTYPDFDVYSVSAQGLSGNIRPYNFQSEIVSQNITDQSYARIVDYYSARDFIGFPPKLKFRFINDFSNSYRQSYNTYGNVNADLKTTVAPFDSNPTYGNNDGNFGFNSVNNLAGSRSIEYFSKNGSGNIVGTAGTTFMQPTVAGLNRDLHITDGGHIAGFKITNSSGVTYHYNLPAYSYSEEVYQKKNGENSSNRQMRGEGYAYTWYLTSITGPDYVDRNNDQKVNEGDWGYWTNFEYGKWCDDYAWRNPSEGFQRDEDNEFGSVSMGKKEIYYLNAIRTRSHIALFEKDLRIDARGAASSIFDKGAQNTYSNPNGGFDGTSKKTLRLNRIYLLNASDAGFVTPESSGTGFYANILDKNDINSVGKSVLESKSIRVVDFNHNYDLCKETTNSFDDVASVKSGKLTLNSIVFRGKGAVNMLPPVEFAYGLSGDEAKISDGTLTNGTFLTNNGIFEIGELVETDESNPLYCGVITKREQIGGSYLYTLKKSKYTGSPIAKRLRNTKNPLYDKDSYDMWGMFKSDYEYSDNENLSRLTNELSNKSVDVWSLRKIKTSLGSDINVSYEGDTYWKSVLNPNLSMIINEVTRVNQTSYIFTVETAGQDLNKLYSLGQTIDFLLLKQESSTQYNNISPSFVLGEGSLPYIESINGNQIQVKVKYNLGLLMEGFPGGNTYTYKLVTGNLKVSGASRYYGGGLRVKSLCIDDLSNKYITNYSYNKLGTAISSGVTSYEPIGLEIDDVAQFGEAAKNRYRPVLYKDMDDIYKIAREVPPPGVMYEYVTIENEIKNIGGWLVTKTPGKTSYQYEIFRKNMVGRLEATPGQMGNYGGTDQYVKNFVLKKFLGTLGALKKITRYDSKGNILSEITNNYLHDGLEDLSFEDFMNQYEFRLSQYNYQGLIKERYAEVKKVRESNASTPNNFFYTIMATLSAKEELPAVPLGQSSKDYITGTETGTENIAFDFYSGALTKMLVKDAYGNKFLTEIEPAYRKNGAMGLKDINGNNSNMLTQEASKTVYKLNTLNQKSSVVSASAQIWSNMVRTDDENGDQTTVGQSNVWRPKSSYQWSMLGTNLNNLTPISSFVSFDFSGTNGTNWKKTGEITRYNTYSSSLEGNDLNNNYAATRMGYRNSKVIATCVPARYKEVAYSGAEDALLSNGKLSTGIALGAGVVNTTMAHTGTHSISLTSGASGISYQVPMMDLDPIRRDYYVSAWVRSSGDVSGARLFYQIDNQTEQINAPTFQKFAGNWYLIEFKIPAIALASGTNLTVGCKNSGGSTVYFDDFRFQPFNSSTVSYVYEPFSGQLSHIINNNNLYVKYEYDAVGRLIKISREVLGKSSVVPVKEISYNYAKPLLTN